MLSELATLNNDLSFCDRLASELVDLEDLYLLACEENDSTFENEIVSGVQLISSELDAANQRLMFGGEHDRADAVCQIKSGQGGTDAQDWAEMLLRMYQRWAEQQGFRCEIIDLRKGKQAGYSSVDFTVKGENVYGWMRSEHGVHRVGRVSRFNNQGKRQTSFAAVEVAPLLENNSGALELELRELRFDTFRASGRGGQHVNVTDSAVRVTHLPTGIAASCQNQRSQHRNKQQALRVLTSRLAQLEEQKQEQQLADIKGEQRSVGFGNQIRSYTFQPHQTVKDHRSGHESSNLSAVLGGDLEPFMASWLQQHRQSEASKVCSYC